ncbi:MAG TPA: two-component regulator propeller domain-containing protein [Cyclobacteriaceae bacterium]
MILKKVVIILFCIYAQISLAQEYTYFNYSIPEKLPSTESYDVFQDSKGFLWFATDNGVSRFDGKEMTNFNIKDGLSDPVVFSFYEDYKGRIWFRTFSCRISYYENGTIHTYRYNSLIEQKTLMSFIFSLYCDTDDKIWLTMDKHIISIDSTGTIERIKSIPEYEFQYLKVDHHELMAYYGPTNDLKYINIGSERFPLHLSDTISNSSVIRSVTWNNFLYISINNDIFEYNGKAIRKVHTGSSNIISLYKDSDNTLWVGYMSHGVKRFNDRTFSSPTQLNFLSEKSVTKTLQDHEGGYWFSTLENGIYHVPNMGITNYSLPTSAKITNVISIGSNFLLADLTGTLTAFNPETKTILWKKSMGAPIMKLFIDSRSNLWVSTTTATYILDADFQQKRRIDRICQIDFYEDAEKKVWSIGSTKIATFNEHGDSLFHRELRTFCRSMLLKDSLLYLTTRLELQIRNLSMKSIPVPEGLKKFKILKLFSINDSLLFASAAGSGYLIIKHKAFTFKEYNTSTTFIANNINASTIIDSALWLATEKGIIKLITNSSFTEKPVYKFITKKSGLPGEKINFLIRNKDFLYAFFDKRLSVLPLNKLNFTYSEPRLYIKKITVNNSILDTTSTESLQYDKNTIEIAFGFIAFNNQDISIRYKLHPTSNWIYTSDRNLLLASMAPDVYNFKLEYSIDGNHWISGISFGFEINLPWWETWYFYTAVMIFLLLIVYIFTTRRLEQYQEKNYYLNVINEHQQKLIQAEIETIERERTRIAKELHDGVGTNLTAIKMHVGQLLKKHNEPVAAEVEQQLQLTIREIKDIIYGLTPAGLERYGLFEGLRDYTERLNNTIQTKISLNVFGPELTKADLKLVVFRIIQELLSNSIKHSSATHITIHVSVFNNLLNIIYEDDGIGFSTDQIKHGLGLNNIDSRIQSVGGNLTFESGEFGVSYTIDIPLS